MHLSMFLVKQWLAGAGIILTSTDVLQQTADARAATDAANVLIQLANRLEKEDETAALPFFSRPAGQNVADTKAVNGTKEARQQHFHNTVSRERDVTAPSSSAALHSRPDQTFEPHSQAAAAARPMSRLMKACALLDKPVQSTDASTTSAITAHDAWQNATAAKIMYDNVQTAADSHRKHSFPNVLPAGIRPCRTDQERQAYVAGAAAKVARDHESIAPALAAAIKQRSRQHAEMLTASMSDFKTASGQTLSINPGKHL